MGEEKAVLVFRREWVDQVKEIIDKKKSVANAGKFPRVATPLLDDKPEAYTPHFVSLGPYHHCTLDKKIAASSSVGDNYEYRKLKMSTAEAYKVESAATLSRKLQSRCFYDMVEMIKTMWQEIEDFYDLPIKREGEYPEHFARMMAIDSCFLLCFLFSQFRSLLEDDMKCLSKLEVSIKCDILKLENQIKLSVLRNVFDIAKEALNDAGHDEFSKQLQKTYKELSPFQQFDIANSDRKIEINKQPHLLGCVHEFISPLLEIKEIDHDQDNRPPLTLFQRMMCILQSAHHSLEVVVECVVALVCTLLHVKHPTDEGRRDILNSYNAVELKKGGIKFKSFSKEPYGIRFDKYSATLYLPRITVSDMQTEVFLRNMVALEFNDTARSDSVTRYVWLMDCLIDTPEDVRLLRESQIILRQSPMLTDDKIVGIWNSMCLPIFTGRLELPDHLNHALEEVLIRKYYMSTVNKVLWEFYWDHLSKPGKGVALLVAILLLAMTFIQTYCTWSDWYGKHKH